MDSFLTLENNGSAKISELTILPYERFYELVLDFLKKSENHCVNYFAFKSQNKLKFICAIANDKTARIVVLCYEIELENVRTMKLQSLTKEIYAMHVFEREIHENYGIDFEDNPWLKPLRCPHDSHTKISEYPFYSIESEQLHEVGVGPIHAGVIEPGHFRFICNGENVLHLEIQLGWQHRGIEKLFLDHKNWLTRNILSENIAGDTAVGHSLAFSSLVEALAEIKISKRLQVERMIALELERIAVCTGDMSALCVDIAYQLGAAVFGVLRTPIINFTQKWCANRLGKGMIRFGGTHYPLTPELRKELEIVLEDYKKKFLEMAHQSYHMMGLQDRFDEIGIVTEEQMQLIGAVGMTARMAGLKRDIRASHPAGGYKEFECKPILLQSGDVFARFLLRSKEIQQSLSLIKKALSNQSLFNEKIENFEANKIIKLNKDSFSISLVEGWRGEICHVMMTNSEGDLAFYKVKDPSLHNWTALQLSLRNLEISDFPINNKSYNLSYCGYDL